MLLFILDGRQVIAEAVPALWVAIHLDAIEDTLRYFVTDFAVYVQRDTPDNRIVVFLPGVRAPV